MRRQHAGLAPTAGRDRTWPRRARPRAPVAAPAPFPALTPPSSPGAPAAPRRAARARPRAPAPRSAASRRSRAAAPSRAARAGSRAASPTASRDRRRRRPAAPARRSLPSTRPRRCRRPRSRRRGVPAAIASISAFDMPSARDGSTKTSIAASGGRTSVERAGEPDASRDAERSRACALERLAQRPVADDQALRRVPFAGRDAASASREELVVSLAVLEASDRADDRAIADRDRARLARAAAPARRPRSASTSMPFWSSAQRQRIPSCSPSIAQRVGVDDHRVDLPRDATPGAHARRASSPVRLRLLASRERHAGEPPGERPDQRRPPLIAVHDVDPRRAAARAPSDTMRAQRRAAPSAGRRHVERAHRRPRRAQLALDLAAGAQRVDRRPRSARGSSSASTCCRWRCVPPVAEQRREVRDPHRHAAASRRRRASARGASRHGAAPAASRRSWRMR